MEQGVLRHQWDLLSQLMSHIEQQNPHIETPRYAWQLNPFELADYDGPPEEWLESQRERQARLAERED